MVYPKVLESAQHFPSIGLSANRNYQCSETCALAYIAKPHCQCMVRDWESVLRDPAFWACNVRDLRVSTFKQLTADITSFCTALCRNRQALDELQIRIKEVIHPLAMEACTQEEVFRAQQTAIHDRIALVTAHWQDNLRLKNIFMFSKQPPAADSTLHLSPVRIIAACVVSTFAIVFSSAISVVTTAIVTTPFVTIIISNSFYSSGSSCLSGSSCSSGSSCPSREFCSSTTSCCCGTSCSSVTSFSFGTSFSSSTSCCSGSPSFNRFTALTTCCLCSLVACLTFTSCHHEVLPTYYVTTPQ
ncbi:hypothetical protein FN846DRAFT_896011 [Sphaerosporella brunnea]|uniref:Uncharacterized protein n=1 Tax=Sphaerosporella brunnea TaxID=1250544 RepID=A0A5J5ECX4_9PEZI|nr:hypothetical protein FN846DRAFT_896011 [Sphaerosporella brunnea]